MTETTTRRGVRPLLALLLTGMALLMMGAAHPVQAATIDGPNVTWSAGGATGFDSITFNCGASWDTTQHPNGAVTYTITEEVAYYSGNTVIGTASIGVAGSSAGSPTSDFEGGAYTAGCSNAKTFAASPGHSDIANYTGFKWHYLLTVHVGDTTTPDFIPAHTWQSPEQSYGAFEQTGGPTGPPTGPPGE